MNAGPRIERLVRDGVVVLELSGEFDLAVASVLRGAFREALAESETVVVDLSRTTFMDSTALGGLVTAQRKAVDRGGEVRLVGLNAGLRRVFRLMALDTVFTSYATVDAAVSGRRKPPSPGPS